MSNWRLPKFEEGISPLFLLVGWSLGFNCGVVWGGRVIVCVEVGADYVVSQY